MDRYQTSISIPDNITIIEQGAFRDYKNMTSVTLPESVIRIGKASFFGCTSLTSISLPDSVTSIGEGAFKGCKNLTSITLPGNLANIDDGIFYGCENLTDINIPESVKSIGEGTFYGCKRLTRLNIPDNVKYIGKWAFYGCMNLTVYCTQKSFAHKYCRKNRIKTALTDLINYKPDIKEKIDEKTVDGAFYGISAKINAYIGEIDRHGKFIADANVSLELAEIKNILSKMINLLKDEKDIEKYSEQLDQFFSSYFPTVMKILDTYRKIEEQGLNVSSAVETKARIAESIPSVRKALEKELDNMYQNKMLDITTDIDVLESMLAKDGLLDKNTMKFDL